MRLCLIHAIVTAALAAMVPKTTCLHHEQALDGAVVSGSSPPPCTAALLQSARLAHSGQNSMLSPVIAMGMLVEDAAASKDPSMIFPWSGGALVLPLHTLGLANRFRTLASVHALAADL